MKDLEGAASTIAEQIVENAASTLGSVVTGPIAKFIDEAIKCGQIDLSLLRACDQRNDTWETRAYKLVTIGREEVRTVDGKYGRGSIDEIEAIQTHHYPSIR